MPDFPYYPYYDPETNTIWTAPEVPQSVTPVNPEPTNPNPLNPNVGDTGVNPIHHGTSPVKDNTRFFSILPKANNAQVYSGLPIPLRVILHDGVKTEPDIEFKTTKLNGNYKLFHNNSGYNDSFTVSVMFHKDDTVYLTYDRPTKGKDAKEVDWTLFEKQLLAYAGLNKEFRAGDFHSKLTVAMDYWIRKGIPFYVHTNAVGINKKNLYLITENKKRTQRYRDGWVEWDLTFTRYADVKKLTFNKNTSTMTKAMKNNNPKAVKAKAMTKARKELAKCNYKKIVYSKKKKVVACVKKMQQVLYLQKFLKKKSDIDGWYGKTTYNAVKAYQKKWSKSYGLKVTGHCNRHTWQVMCGKGKKVTTTNKGKSTTTVKVAVPSGDGVVTSANPSVTVKALNADEYIKKATETVKKGKVSMKAKKITSKKEKKLAEKLFKKKPKKKK
jgi:peptidoglycan hydrolase-like protein with peptidoglycan-binding domain